MSSQNTMTSPHIDNGHRKAVKLLSTSTPVSRRRDERGKLPWYMQPGLLQGSNKHIPYGMITSPVSYGPTAEQVQEVIQKGDAILISIDFELLCRERLQPNGTRAHPITEIGMTTLDLRTLRGRKEAGKSLLQNPGDRGINWVPHCLSTHIINDMYSDHCPMTCRMRWDHTNPYNFVYGMSQFVRDQDIGDYLNQRFRELRTSNRNKEELRERTQRDIVLLTWASLAEEKVLQFEKVGEFVDGMFLNMFQCPGVLPWDIQKHEYINDHFGSEGTDGKKAERAIYSLGIPIPPELGQVQHNAGNDAAYAMKMFLVLANLGSEQVKTYCKRREALDMITD